MFDRVLNTPLLYMFGRVPNRPPLYKKCKTLYSPQKQPSVGVLKKSVLKICCKFKRKHPSRSAVSIKLQSKTASEISTLFSFLKEKKEFHTIINFESEV